MRHTLFLLSALCCLALAVRAGDRRIVLDGVPLSADTHAIILPDAPTPTEAFAARELQSFLAQITGQQLAVETEGASSRPYGLYLGRSAHSDDSLGVEGIALACREGNLKLAGGKRGVLYAVFTFLEDYLGCHWFTPDCSVIPDHGETGIPAFSYTYIPPLEFRDIDFRETRNFEFGIRNKLNGLYLGEVANEENGGCHTYTPAICHTFWQLVPVEQYGAEHPEYYAERDGKRVTGRTNQENQAVTQLCLTNPDVLRIATETVRQWMRNSSSDAFISVSQNDNQRYCTCASCTALAEQEESQAGPLLHFVNAIAREMAKEFPGRQIDTLAYQYTRKPPKFVRPEPNVMIRLCSIECCFLHPLEDCRQESGSRTSFQADLVEWSKQTKQLYVWDYVINYAHSIAPFPNLHVLKPNINFLVANHVRGIYEEGNYFSGVGDMEELRSYVMAKLLWDPQYDDKRAINEFTDAYYGPAAPAIRNYLALLHDSMAADGDQIHMHIFDQPGTYLRHPKVLNQANDILAVAEALVADQPDYLRRVQVARLPIIYVRRLLNVSPETSQADLDFIIRVGRENGLDRVSEGLAFEDWIANQQKN